MKKPLYTIVDVKKTCNELLQTTFPNITVYGNGVYDGYTRPSFFTEILECDQVRAVGKEFPDQGVHCGRFTGSGRSHDHDHSGGQTEKLIDLRVLRCRNPNSTPV